LRKSTISDSSSFSSSAPATSANVTFLRLSSPVRVCALPNLPTPGAPPPPALFMSRYHTPTNSTIVIRYGRMDIHHGAVQPLT